jgi:hypothetical protein
MENPTTQWTTALIIIGALVAASGVSYSMGARHGFDSGLESGFQFGLVSHAMSVIESQYHGSLGVD